MPECIKMMDILQAEKLDICFYSGSAEREVHAVNNVSFKVKKGEFLGVVGESGSGKSTVAKIITGLLKPDKGEVYINGELLRYPYKKETYRTIQMVFQMPQESFDPRRRIGPCIVDMQKNFGYSKKEALERTKKLLLSVGLDESYYSKYPHQMSGGECQRAAIARALSVSPEIIVCDEVTSALDVSVQAQVVDLLRDLHRTMDITMIFISHDLALVSGLCDRIMIMHDGIIVEEGSPQKVMQYPDNKYTKDLLDAILTV